MIICLSKCTTVFISADRKLTVNLLYLCPLEKIKSYSDVLWQRNIITINRSIIHQAGVFFSELWWITQLIPCFYCGLISLITLKTSTFIAPFNRKQHKNLQKKALVMMSSSWICNSSWERMLTTFIPILNSKKNQRYLTVLIRAKGPSKIVEKSRDIYRFQKKCLWAEK